MNRQQGAPEEAASALPTERLQLLSDEPFRFLDLPGELRNEVYKFILEPNRPRTPVDVRGGHEVDRKIDSRINILRACKQTQEEAEGLLRTKAVANMTIRGTEFWPSQNDTAKHALTQFLNVRIQFNWNIEKDYIQRITSLFTESSQQIYERTGIRRSLSLHFRKTLTTMELRISHGHVTSSLTHDILQKLGDNQFAHCQVHVHISQHRPFNWTSRSVEKLRWIYTNLRDRVAESGGNVKIILHVCDLDTASLTPLSVPNAQQIRDIQVKLAAELSDIPNLVFEFDMPV